MVKGILLSSVMALMLASNIAAAQSEKHSAEKSRAQHERASIEKREAHYAEIAANLEARCGKRLNWDAGPKAIHQQRECAQKVMESVRANHKKWREDHKPQRQEMREKQKDKRQHAVEKQNVERRLKDA